MQPCLLIRETCQRLRRIYLKDHTLVSSAEPCLMCSGAIKWAKITRVVFSVPQSFLQEVSGGRLKPSCESLLNSGRTPVEVIGDVLLEEGRAVFDGFTFVPKDAIGRRPNGILPR